MTTDRPHDPPISPEPQHDSYDVVIVGGATMGSSIAWHLTNESGFDGRILVVEPDPTFLHAATATSNNCMRQQFATEVNIRVSQYAASFVTNLRHHLGGDPEIPNLQIRNFGYLYLADTEQFADVLRDDQRLQAGCGAGTQILSTAEIAERYPFYALDDIVAASLNTVDEGAFDAPLMVEWLRRAARRNGVDYIANRVVGLSTSGTGVDGVTLEGGQRITAGHVVNAAGTGARSVGALVGVDLPIEPRRRYTFIFDAATPLDRDLPLTIDPTGVHMRSFGDHDYLVGCPPLHGDPAVDVADFSFEPGIWDEKLEPLIRRRIPALGRLTVTDSWVGHYDFNTFDQNAIVGPHHELENFLLCCGFSGHGTQQAPAFGRGIAELIAHSEFRTLDLSDLSYNRIPENRPLVERAVI